MILSLMRSPSAAFAIFFLALLVVLALCAPILPLDPFKQDFLHMLEGPSRLYLFGTDELGRDILARVLYGARTSLLTAAGAVLVAMILGIPMGLWAGYYGGWQDAALMRLVDVILALPAILFAMALIAVFGRSQGAALLAVGITGVPSFARIVRAQVLTLRKRDFVAAAESFGAPPHYIMTRTLLPNIWSQILVQIVVLASLAILLEAALAFLGVGVPPPTPSWGDMLRTGKSYLHEAPSYALLPGIVLTLAILCFDLIGRRLQALLEKGGSA